LIITSVYGVNVQIIPDTQNVDAGQIATYEIEIENMGSVSSIFNVELLGIDPSMIQYTLSSTSTNVLNSGETQAIYLSMTPLRSSTVPASSYSFIINAYLSSPELLPDISDSDTANLIVNPFREVEIEYLPLDGNAIEPGDSMFSQIAIRNMGNVGDIFMIDMIDGMGNYPGWYSLTTDQVSLAPGEETIIELEVIPPRECNTIPGITSHEVQAMSVYDASIFDSDLLDIEVLSFHEIDVEVDPSSTALRPGESVDYTFTIHNLGNVVDDYEINIVPYDFQDGYLAYPTIIEEDWVHVDNPSIIYDEVEKGWYGILALEPCQQEVITLTVTVPSEWIGLEETNYMMNLAAILGADNSILDYELVGQTVIPTLESMKGFVNWEIDRLNDMIQDIPEEYFTNPNRRTALNNKLIALKDLIICELFEDAYDKLLHDIKPKLTGLKEDENEAPWGNGIFINSWIKNLDIQNTLKRECNKILEEI
jgi:uncharacterized repeat protein (TIGR01451 family)